MASKEFDDLMVMLSARPEGPRMTLEARRDLVRKTAALFRMPEGVEETRGNASGIPVAWLTPRTHDAGRVILYLHGGGYCLGSIDTHKHLAAMLAESAGARACIVDYRLAPEHPFPAAVDDAVGAYCWLIHMQRVAPDKVIVAGDSAGGGLVVSMLVAVRDAGLPLPAAGVCLSPWTDLTSTSETLTTKAKEDPIVQIEDTKELAEWYLGDRDWATPLASPLFADLKGLPPLLIHVGSAETLLNDSLHLAEKAEGAGVDITLDVWDEMIHVWHFYAQLIPEGRDAIAAAAAFMKEKFGKAD